MPTYEFQTVESAKGQYFEGRFPDGVVRVTKNNLVIAADVSEKLLSGTKYKTPASETNAKVGIAVDTRNQAIQLSAVPNGFAVKISDSGVAYGRIPINFRRSGLPTGDYKLVEGERNVFQLAR